ncbi:hypothetical protein Tco_0819988 [Tanacetum coccineum]|uniref:CCHC-type domain-containing protein n=1 Tax=Tanacetum coccineum TaxID=301880 RepID=A0ABQ5A9W0_9ASTR
MTSFNQRECKGCGQPCDGCYCYLCTCQQCGVKLINGICLNCTYGGGKPVTCCGCECPLNGGFCSFCASRAGNSFAYDPNPNSFNDSQNLSDYPPQPQYQTYSCELCGNDAHYGYDCPPQVSFNCPAFYDDDDEYTIQYREYLENSSNAITPDLPTEEPDNSLSMGDEHLSIIPETESDKLIKSSVENLVPIQSESEDFSDNESECDVPVCDDFTTFSNPLFDSDDDFSFSDDESFSDEDVPKENFKIYLNPLFDEEIISSKIDLHHFNAESDLIESLRNRDISTVSYPNIDYLLEEFSGELTHINLIPPGINKADFDPEEEIRLIEELLYDNSSPRPPKESNSEISDATIESSSPSPIHVEDSDSLMEEIDLFLDPDDSIPPGIKSDDYDSEGDILFLKELLSNDSLSLPETESSHFDHYDVPSSPRPPAKPPDDGIFFDFEPDTGDLTAKVVKDISEHYVLMPKLLPTQPTLCPDIDTLLPFSSENEDKVFNPGILSSPLLSHRGKFTSDFSESPMMISGGNIPVSDILIASDFEDSRARGFVHRPLDLQSFACLY